MEKMICTSDSLLPEMIKGRKEKEGRKVNCTLAEALQPKSTVLAS